MVVQAENIADAAREFVMQRIRHPAIRNKINASDPTQMRALTRRLGVSEDALRAIVNRVGNSVATVTKEVELQRATRHVPLAPPL